MNKNLQFGVVGLGKMGSNLALQALEKNMNVAGFDLHGIPAKLKEAGLDEVEDLDGFKAKLKTPRIVFIYVPAGPVVDDVLDQLSEKLDPGDILVDGGNSYWGDSLRRSQKYGKQGYGYVDLGTSGGVGGARYGACFMAGGKQDVVEKVEPILVELAVKGGYVHAGPPAAGHFVKLVHNGIEFGMLQAIAEGMDLLENYRETLPVAEVLHCWSNGSVIRSWLVELMEQGYREKGGMTTIPPFVEDTGEVNWLVNDALHMEVAIPVIAQSVMQLFESRDDQKNSARAIAMMRHGFGGHPFGRDEGIVRERKTGRVGPFPRRDDE